ncbi:unnamed protein product [Calypogeia fissa]
MAIQRILEYSSILECIEGDNAFELEKAQILVRAMETVLTKAALDTDLAKKRNSSAVNVTISPLAATTTGVGVHIAAATFVPGPPRSQPTVLTSLADAASDTLSGPTIELSSSDHSPSSTTVFPPNNPRVSFDVNPCSVSPIPLSVTPPTPVNSFASSSASSSSADLRSTI